jgi:hypothetical protein
MFVVAHAIGGGPAFWAFLGAGATTLVIVVVALVWEFSDLLRGRRW